MKIVLIVVAAVVLVILSVIVIGALLPKRHVVSRAAWFRTTPDRLFDRITGPQDWRPDVARSENIKDAGGKNLLRETSPSGETITYEISNQNPPSSLTRRIATENLPYSGTWTFSLQPRDGGTLLRVTEDGEVYNPVFRFVSRFILGHTKTIDTYLRALGKSTGQEVQITD